MKNSSKTEGKKNPCTRCAGTKVINCRFHFKHKDSNLKCMGTSRWSVVVECTEILLLCQHHHSVWKCIAYLVKKWVSELLFFSRISTSFYARFCIILRTIQYHHKRSSKAFFHCGMIRVDRWIDYNAKSIRIRIRNSCILTCTQVF